VDIHDLHFFGMAIHPSEADLKSVADPDALPVLPVHLPRVQPVPGRNLEVPRIPDPVHLSQLSTYHRPEDSGTPPTSPAAIHAVEQVHCLGIEKASYHGWRYKVLRYNAHRYESRTRVGKPAVDFPVRLESVSAVRSRERPISGLDEDMGETTLNPWALKWPQGPGVVEIRVSRRSGIRD
jgi:hypothetical protein